MFIWRHFGWICISEFPVGTQAQIWVTKDAFSKENKIKPNIYFWHASLNHWNLEICLVQIDSSIWWLNFTKQDFTAPQKIFPLKHVLSVKGVGCSLWSANTPILKINFWNCSSHWLLATSTINSNQHLHQLQDTPHYDNPPPINLQSKTTNPWIWKILLKNHSSVIIKVSFLF